MKTEIEPEIRAILQNIISLTSPPTSPSNPIYRTRSSYFTYTTKYKIILYITEDPYITIEDNRNDATINIDYGTYYLSNPKCFQQIKEIITLCEGGY